MEEKLTVILDKLAEKLGVAVDVLWGALMKQALISSLSDLLWVFAMVLGGWLLVRYFKVVSKKREECEWDEVAWFPFGGMCIVYGVLFIITMSGISNMLAGFFNPEYWALMKILARI